jgi:hypothetical protein
MNDVRLLVFGTLCHFCCIVCVALHFLREPETFLLLQSMLKQSKNKVPLAQRSR